MSNTAAGPSSKVRPGASQPSESTKRKRGIFQKDLQHMMYGYGDDANPLHETVSLVEDIVVDYVTDMAHKAQDTATKRGKLMIEDFLFLFRKDLPKLNRCSKLLSMNEELKRGRLLRLMKRNSLQLTEMYCNTHVMNVVLNIKSEEGTNLQDCIGNCF